MPQKVNNSKPSARERDVRRVSTFANVVTGSPVAGQLLHQIEWWYTKTYRPFYKFRAPVGRNENGEYKNSRYTHGDSWTEELGFTESMFDTALSKIGTKIKTREINMPMLQEIPEGITLPELARHLVYYWTDASRVTWYQLNVGLLETLRQGFYALVDNQVEVLAADQEFSNLLVEQSRNRDSLSAKSRLAIREIATSQPIAESRLPSTESFTTFRNTPLTPNGGDGAPAFDSRQEGAGVSASIHSGGNNNGAGDRKPRTRNSSGARNHYTPGEGSAATEELVRATAQRLGKTFLIENGNKGVAKIVRDTAGTLATGGIDTVRKLDDLIKDWESEHPYLVGKMEAHHLTNYLSKRVEKAKARPARQKAKGMVTVEYEQKIPGGAAKTVRETITRQEYNTGKRMGVNYRIIED